MDTCHDLETRALLQLIAGTLQAAHLKDTWFSMGWCWSSENAS